MRDGRLIKHIQGRPVVPADCQSGVLVGPTIWSASTRQAVGIRPRSASSAAVGTTNTHRERRTVGRGHPGAARRGGEWQQGRHQRGDPRVQPDVWAGPEKVQRRHPSLQRKPGHVAGGADGHVSGAADAAGAAAGRQHRRAAGPDGAAVGIAIRLVPQFDAAGNPSGTGAVHQPCRPSSRRTPSRWA